MGLFGSRKSATPPKKTSPAGAAPADARMTSQATGPPFAGSRPAARSSGRSSTPPMIELSAVNQRFGSQVVLRDISLAVEEGETLVIIGESGCGKSVTLKLMMALFDASGGQVFWRGQPVAAMSERQRAKERLSFGFLFQGAALFDSMSVSENVAFGLRQNTDLSETKIKEIVRDRLREVGLREAVCDRKPADLSGGMKKRVALARALALEPEVMFYDEPTTGLDPVMSDVINELILRTKSRGRVTSIVVTHDMRTVERVADRVIMLYPSTLLRPGEPQIVFAGTARELEKSPDPRVTQFVNGNAGERIEELSLT
jgi:phospholipid/cholesterol/gamma-HCH transport system ATP-binding protein